MGSKPSRRAPQSPERVPEAPNLGREQHVTLELEKTQSGQATTESIPTIPKDISFVEEKVMLEWCNHHLRKVDLRLGNLHSDAYDGFFVILLIDIITGDKLEGFKSRTAKEQSISNPVWVSENQAKIRDWVGRKTSAKSDASPFNHLNSSFTDVFIKCVWILLGISIGNDNIGISHTDNTEITCQLCASMTAPFVFDDMNCDSKDNVILFRAAILYDRVFNDNGSDGSLKEKKWSPPPQNYKTSSAISPIIFEQGVLRVFLSSTFRDMQRERDKFFEQGAPELRRLAKSKGIDLVFIDLRWGLTAEDSSDGWVVIRCCDSIKKCAYFVCHLGARYGWVPDQSDPKQWHPETNVRFPFLDEIPGLSVTEYEIQYAALNKSPSCSRVFFYFRDEVYVVEHAKGIEEKKLYQAENEESMTRQNKLKSVIRERFGTVTYTSPEDFTSLVVSHLTHSINEDFANRKAQDPEEQSHLQFMFHRLAGFEGRQDLIKDITTKVFEQLNDSMTSITTLAAESGIGKSSLMAATVRELQGKNAENVIVVYHFVGCTNLSNYVESISTRFWKIFIENESISDPQLERNVVELKKHGITGLFKFIESTQLQKKYIFLIDAINQIHASQETPVPQLLTWLPKTTPNHVALVVSTIDTHESCKNAISEGLDIIPVKKLSRKEISDAIVSFLNRFDKKLSEVQMDMILGNENNTGHPLYLRLVLEEIRIFGIYEKLDMEIQTLLNTHDVIELYGMIISRWEAKFTTTAAPIVEKSMKVLYVSRIGLSEGEFDKYLGDAFGDDFDLAKWKSFFFTLVESLFVRNGRYMYFHQLLLETTEKRFFQRENSLTETFKEYGKWLYNQYGDDENIEEEVVSEICFQLLRGENYEILIDYLRNEHVIIKMLNGRYRYEFFSCWRRIEEKGIAQYKEIYRRLSSSLAPVGDCLVEFMLEAFENAFLIPILSQRIGKRNKEENRVSDYISIAKVYYNLENWSESMSYLQKAVGIKLKSSDIADEYIASLYDEIGNVYLKDNRIQQAHENYGKSMEIRKKMYGVDDVNVAQSYDRFGDVFIKMKKLTDGRKSYELAMEIRSKKLGNNHPLFASSLQNMARIQLEENDLEKSYQSYTDAANILKKTIGDKHPTYGLAIQGLSSILILKKDLEKALAILKTSLDILVHGLGENHPAVISTYEKIGNILSEMKKHQEALNSYRKTLEIRKRTIGPSHPDTATALENVGRTNLALKREDQIGEFFEEAARIRYKTKTMCSVTNLVECIQVSDTLDRQNLFSAVVVTRKNVIALLMQKGQHDSLLTWRNCMIIDHLMNELEMHQDAVEFWVEMKTIFSENLGWVHEKTLHSYQMLSYHSRKLGVQKEPIQFMEVGAFIIKNVPEARLSEEFEQKTIVNYLFQIVCSSRENEHHACEASTAITILNFMGISFGNMDLSRIRIPHANLNGANFESANLAGADLKAVDMANAIIEQCNFSGASLSGLKLGIPCGELQHHTDAVNSICSIRGPEGEYWVASASDDETITISNLANGQLVKTLTGHEGQVAAVCKVYGANGEIWLASAGEDMIARIWDFNSGKMMKMLTGHLDAINSLCFTRGPKGEYLLASASSDKTIILWDVTSGEQVTTLCGHEWKVWSVCAIEGPSGEKWLVSGSEDYSVRLWDLKTRKDIRIFKGHRSDTYSVSAVKGIDDGVWIVAGSYDGTVSVWDVNSRDKIWGLNPDIGPLNCVHAFEGIHGERFLLVVGEDKLVHIWDLQYGTEIGYFSGNRRLANAVHHMKGPNDDIWILSGGDDNSVRVWEFSSQSLRYLNEKDENHSATQDVISQLPHNCPTKAKQGNTVLKCAQKLSSFNRAYLKSLGGVETEAQEQRIFFNLKAKKENIKRINKSNANG